MQYILFFMALSAINSVVLMQTPSSRAINVGYIHKKKFIPCRLNLGVTRLNHTFQATVDSFKLPQVKKILEKYQSNQISTITILREALACQLGLALNKIGVKNHYGDAFIGVMHIKQNGIITTSYQYENIEGLTTGGLWVIADSICVGRNLGKTIEAVLSKQQPQEILFICPLASSMGIENISKIVEKFNIPITFVAWGALFGVNKDNLYDMPWGDEDTVPVDQRDLQTFISIYSPGLCVGGDFGNDYYCPTLAEQLYKEQLKELKITPKIPSVRQILKVYKKDELIIE